MLVCPKRDVSGGSLCDNASVSASSCVPHIGPILRRLRISQGLTQSALAQASGIRQNYVHYIERGLRVPALDVLENVCRALGTPTSAVIAEAELAAQQVDISLRA